MVQYAGMKFRTHAQTIGQLDCFVVQKMHHGEWVDWVIVAQSTIAGAGRGIFAACIFDEWDFIGRYVGKVLGLRMDITDAVLRVSAPLIAVMALTCSRKAPLGSSKAMHECSICRLGSRQVAYCACPALASIKSGTHVFTTVQLHPCLSPSFELQEL